MAILSRILFNRRGRQGLRVSPVYSNDEKSTLSVIAEDEEDDWEIESNDDWLPRCINLLSSVDTIGNLSGLRKLLETTRDRGFGEQASVAFIYGDGPDEIRLRQIFVRFLSNDSEKNEGNEESVSESSDSTEVDVDDDNDDSYLGESDAECWSDSEEENDSFPRGKESVINHGHALQIILSSLETVSQTDDLEGSDSTEVDADDDNDDSYLGESDAECWSDSEEENDSFPRGKESGIHHGLALQIILSSLVTVSQTDDLESKSIDFSDPFWKSVVGSLINDIETDYSNEITTTTLSCFRLLHTLEPVLVEPFLNQVLLPYLLHLRDYSDHYRLPLMNSEASRLLSRADNYYTKQLVMV
jgi:hypothetical protein